MKNLARFFALSPARLALRSRVAPVQSRKRRGSSLVETALCLSFVLLPLLLGGLQFGLVLTTTHALQQVSREAGRFAALHYGEPTFDSSDSQGNSGGSDPSLRHYIRQVAQDNGIPYDDIKDKITVSLGVGSRSSGQPITVTISYPMNKRSILGQPGKSANLYFSPSNGGNSTLNFLSEDYTVASTFVMQ